MKKSAKKASADEKVERKKTGGGSCDAVVDVTSEKVLAILGNRAKPLCNPYDADAEYNGEIGDFGKLPNIGFKINVRYRDVVSVSTSRSRDPFLKSWSRLRFEIFWKVSISSRTKKQTSRSRSLKSRLQVTFYVL